KRKLLSNADTQQLFVDGKQDWTVDILQTGTDYTLTAALAISVVAARGHPFTIKSSSTTRPLITTATNSINLLNISSAQFLNLTHLSLSNTAGTKGTTSANGRAIVPAGATALDIWIDDCIIDGFEVGIDGENQTYFTISPLSVTRCEIKNSVLEGIRNQHGIYLDKCYIHSNSGDGMNRPTNATGNDAVVISNSVFAANTGRGYYDKNTSAGGLQ